MKSNAKPGLLTARDATPAGITNREGPSLFLLLGDHAGNGVPERLALLGLHRSELSRHIALDIGVESLGSHLASELDAPFVSQSYSRLVVDCNRALSHADAIAAVSDGTPIPGNLELSHDQRRARADAIYHPYHNAIADLLIERDRRGLRTIVVSLHSFTPSLGGITRPWQVGVLYGGGENSFAKAVLSEFRQSGWAVGDNLPYQFDDTDLTIPKHAIASGRPYVELEIRQDMLDTHDAVAALAKRLRMILIEASSQ
jgi:Predicted N-formylglutamate amidohydrolase